MGDAKNTIYGRGVSMSRADAILTDEERERSGLAPDTWLLVIEIDQDASDQATIGIAWAERIKATVEEPDQ